MAVDRPSNPLVQRLRFCAGPWSDPHLSTEAADEIERLTRERDEWKKQASGGIDSEWDARMELEKLRAERDRLRAALSGLIDAYYGNSYDTWHKAMIRAREALDRPKDRPAE